MRFYQDHAPIDCIQHCHWLSYAKDFLGKFNLPIVSLCEGDRLTGMSHVELRHDVDRQLDVAIAMAHIERNLGVTATYFFLHPDGVLNRSNYFGYIKKNRVHIAPAFIEAALEIQDMGHEIGLHNDLISLWIGTGISPKDHLEEILACLRGHGIRVSGTAAHGSRLCHMHQYCNYQIFKEMKPFMTKNMSKSITLDGKTLVLYSLSMSEFDLKYEAYLRNYSVCTSDSGNVPVICTSKNKQNLTKDNINNEIIADQICKFEQPSTIQCLVHPDHWSIQLASGNGNIKKGLDDIENRFLNSKKQTTLFIIENSPSLLYANIQNMDSSYNQAYNKNVFHFPNQASWLNSLSLSLSRVPLSG